MKVTPVINLTTIHQQQAIFYTLVNTMNLFIDTKELGLVCLEDGNLEEKLPPPSKIGQVNIDIENIYNELRGSMRCNLFMSM